MADCRQPGSDAATGTRLVGPLRVRAEAETIARFAAALGVAPIRPDGRPVVPATFPICWMLHPAIRSLVYEATGRGAVVVHEAQDIAYESEIERDGVYDLRASVAPGTAPGRIVVTGRVSDLSGRPVCTLTSRLLIIAASPEHAP